MVKIGSWKPRHQPPTGGGGHDHLMPHGALTRHEAIVRPTSTARRTRSGWRHEEVTHQVAMEAEVVDTVGEITPMATPDVNSSKPFSRIEAGTHARSHDIDPL